jgi:hypothetical protein
MGRRDSDGTRDAPDPSTSSKDASSLTGLGVATFRPFSPTFPSSSLPLQPLSSLRQPSRSFPLESDQTARQVLIKGVPSLRQS